jgi:uncharacterized protein (DUF1015 family)
MADVRRFRGLRYSRREVGDLGQVVCPPYDVISPAQARALRQRSALNAIHLELPEPESASAPEATKYQTAARTLQRWCAEGVLQREDAASVYAVEETFGWEQQTLRRRGILAVVRLAEWSERQVLPHEKTLAAPRADRLELLRACATNISPVFLLHSPRPKIETVMWEQVLAHPPAAELSVDEDYSIRIWSVGDLSLDWLRGLRAGALYIADGHHRYETALRYRDERSGNGAATDDAAVNFVLSYLVSLEDPGLLVLPTHRVVPRFDLDAMRLKHLIAENFDSHVVPLTHRGPREVSQVLAELRSRGAEGTTFALYQPHQVTLLTPLAAALDSMPQTRAPAWRSLDVARLESLLLTPLLGPEVAEKLRYARDAVEACNAVDTGEAEFAILLNPPTPQSIAAVADAGERMPQKSTYFYPKLPTGLVFHALDDVAVE